MKHLPCVQLRSARIPSIPGLIADHFWFVIDKQGDFNKKDRWEVWQNRDCGGESWCYLHKNLKAYSDNVGTGKSKKIQEWYGEEAERLIIQIENSVRNYPYQEKYRYWPGPNSNTYVQWILEKSKIDYMLGSSAIGKDYLPRVFSFKKNRGYIQIASPIFGIKIKWLCLLEVHILTLSIGVCREPLRITIPLLRL